MDTFRIFKTQITRTDTDKVTKKLLESRGTTVAICNANTLVRSYNNEDLNKKINSFDIKCPDGFPVAKSFKYLHGVKQNRVDGYKVFHNTIIKGIPLGLSHYFFGSNDEIVTQMIKNLKIMYPNIEISGYFCPPIKSYEELTKDIFVQDMRDKNADVVWVSLGFPKQEEFIYELRNQYTITSNLVGVGAVFEWVAKTKFKAPELLANLGLEWIIRLIQEPKRLFRRYLIDNCLFIIYFIKQYLSR